MRRRMTSVGRCRFFRNVAYWHHTANLMESWQSLALSADKTHILALHGDPQRSWSLSYNLYADRLLRTNIVPLSVSPFERFSAEDLSLTRHYQVLANHTKFLRPLFATGTLHVLIKRCGV